MLYGVNASMISVEASISNRRRELTSALAPTSAAAAAALAAGPDTTPLTTTTLATTTFTASVASTAVTSTAAAADDDDDDHRRRLSSSLLLTVTILVPTPELEASADGSQAGGQGTGGAPTAGDGGSDQPPAADGAAGGSAGYLPDGSVNMKVKAEEFAVLVGALNAGNFSLGTVGVCALLFNVTGATSTIVSEAEVRTSITNPSPNPNSPIPTPTPTPTLNRNLNPHPTPTQVKTDIKEVSVSCPKGYWCSAGLTVECNAGSYNVCHTGLEPQTSRPMQACYSHV